MIHLRSFTGLVGMTLGFVSMGLGGAAAAASSDADQLEEIVVTAQKYEESAQKTAIAMNVYSGDELRSQGVNDIQSLTHIDPSINFTASNGTAYVAVRGIASTDTTETGDPAISVARDGFYTNLSFSLFGSMYDVARVEVLKGPQGTLYGRNTAGGVINIISQRPTDTFGGYAQLDASNYHGLNLEGAVNLPLGERVQLRVSGVSLYHSGYRKNPSVNPVILSLPNGDDANSRSGRLQLAFQPWKGFNGLVSVQADATTGTGDVPMNGPWGTSGPPDISAPGPTPSVPYGAADGWPMRSLTSTSLNETRYRWQFSQDLPGELTLAFLGGYASTTWKHALDGTAYPVDSNVSKQFVQELKPATQNEEIRLSNAPGSRLFWQVGGFYFRETIPLVAGFYTFEGPFAGQCAACFDYHMTSTSKAAFGQVEFKFTDSLKASAGLRYTQDHKVRTGSSVVDVTVASDGFLWFDPSVLPNNPVVPVFFCSPACVHFVIGPQPGNGDVTNSRVTYHLGLDWTPREGTLVYAKYDTGYKAGGFNSNGSAPSVNYDPEDVRSFEVGTKNRLLDNRLEANLSLFHMRYEGYQANQFTAAVGGGLGVFNAGNAKIYGAEGELAWLIQPRTRLNVSATWLHAKFTDGCASDASVTYLPTAPSCGSLLAGHFLPNSPSASATAGIEQGWSATGGEWTARLQGKYQSKYYFDIFNHDDLTQRAYVLGDLLLAYAPSQSRWNFEAYVHNFADTAVLNNALRNNLVASNNYQFHAPRVYGIKVGAHF